MKVTIETHRNKLRLLWQCPIAGKRVTLSIGVPSSKPDRSLAESIKGQIERDFQFGYYKGKQEYEKQTVGYRSKELTTVELFDRFTKYKQKDKVNHSMIHALSRKIMLLAYVYK